MLWHDDNINTIIITFIILFNFHFDEISFSQYIHQIFFWLVTSYAILKKCFDGHPEDIDSWNSIDWCTSTRGFGLCVVYGLRKACTPQYICPLYLTTADLMCIIQPTSWSVLTSTLKTAIFNFFLPDAITQSPQDNAPDNLYLFCILFWLVHGSNRLT